METLEELKAIIAGKPEGATDFSNRFNRLMFYKYSFLLGWFYWDGGCYIPLNTFPSNKTRSLSDIERVIELMEIVGDAAALGFLTPSFDSGVSHKQLCKKYEAMKL